MMVVLCERSVDVRALPAAAMFQSCCELTSDRQRMKPKGRRILRRFVLI